MTHEERLMEMVDLYQEATENGDETGRRWIRTVILPAMKDRQTNLFDDGDVRLAESDWESRVVESYLAWAHETK